jgi:hypothetical protein
MPEYTILTVYRYSMGVGLRLPVAVPTEEVAGFGGFAKPCGV